MREGSELRTVTRLGLGFSALVVAAVLAPAAMAADPLESRWEFSLPSGDRVLGGPVYGFVATGARTFESRVIEPGLLLGHSIPSLQCAEYDGQMRLTRVSGSGAVLPARYRGTAVEMQRATGGCRKLRDREFELLISEARIARLTWSDGGVAILFHWGCAPPRVVRAFPLTGLERTLVRVRERVRLAYEITRAKAAIAALGRDSARNPSHRARNGAAVIRLRSVMAALVRDRAGLVGRSQQGAAEDVATHEQVVEAAVCGGLEAGKEHLTEYLRASGKGAHVELTQRLGDLATVLNHNATGDPKLGTKERRKLLEANLIALQEKLGGEKVGALSGKLLTLHKILLGQLDEKELDKALRDEIQALAKRLAGDKAAELTRQVIILRDVLAGDTDPEKQYEVLKTSVVGLATRLAGRNVLNTPYARAAMLGFAIGKAFADSIEADLQVIRDTVLARECLDAIARAQGRPNRAQIDWGVERPTGAFIAAPAAFKNWNCRMVPRSAPEGDDFLPLVEATSPVKRYVFGLITTGGESVYFDPRWVS